MELLLNFTLINKKTNKKKKHTNNAIFLYTYMCLETLQNLISSYETKLHTSLVFIIF
jgi:hypothetical protein